MGKQCRKIFGQELLDELGETRVERMEAEIQRRINDLQNHPDGIKNIDDIDASRIGGDAGETGLQYIARQVLEQEIVDTKQIFKTKFVEANKVTNEIDTIKGSIKFFLDVYGKEGRSGLARFFTEAKEISKALKENNLEPLMKAILTGRVYEGQYSRFPSLERLKQSTFGQYWGQMIDKRLSDELGDNWYKNNASKKQDIIDILDDLVAMQKDPTRSTSVKNSNSPQYAVAKAFRDSFERMMKENNMIGGKMNFFNLMPKPKLNPNKLKTKARQEEAINDIAKALDDETVFNLTDLPRNSTREAIEAEKIKIAKQEVDRTVNAGADQNGFGKSTDKNRDYLVFKDGESLYTIFSKYSNEDDFVGMMFRQITKLTDQHALTKITGARPQSYIRTLKQQMEADPELRNFANSEGMRRYEMAINQLVEPRQVGRNGFVESINALRNIQLLKLGFVPIDQLIMEPIFAFMRMRKEVGIFNLMGNIGPLQGKKKRLAARFHGVAMEHYIGAINNRLYGSLAGNFSDGVAANITSKISNKFMRYTGATLLSDGQAAAGFAAFKMDITQAFNKGRSWKKLTKDKPEFIIELQKAGIDEQMWNQAMRGFKNGTFKGEDGMFDPGLLTLAETKVRSRGITDYDAWMAYFQKRVDGYSRMRPGELETERLKMYSDNEVAGAVLKTLTQFKSFTLSVGRRVYGDAYQRGGKLAVMQTAAYMVVPMFIAGIAATQAREMLKNKAPMQFGPELFGRAWTRTGVSGWLTFFMFDDLVEQGINAFYPETKNDTKRNIIDSYTRDILGPAFSEMVNLAGSGIELFGETIATAVDDPKADLGKQSFYTLKDLVKTVAPNGFPMSAFVQWLMYDVLEKSFHPDVYYKRERRNTKRMLNERVGGKGSAIEWLQDL